MARKVVNHLNYIGYPIMAPQLATQGDAEVFCKKRHAVIDPSIDDCKNCPYFGGVMQGYGHECIWEDIVPAEIEEVIVEHSDRQKEFMRVSKLIDQGYLKKG